MKIEISENGIVHCDGTICDPLALFDSCAECGNCPLVGMLDQFLDSYFDGACEPR